MSFANDFKRNQRGITEEIAFYRSYAGLDGMEEFITILEEMRNKWKELEARYQGRGKMPSEPFDWDEDQQIRSAAKESMNKIIKAATAAEEGEPQESSGTGIHGNAPPSAEVLDPTPPPSAIQSGGLRMQGIAMSLYVQYHNYETEGLWLNNAPGQFGIRTRLSPVQDAIGGRVFLIFGIGSPRRYYLWNSFTVENVEESVDHDGQTTYHATGPGWYLSPPQRLAGPEFDDFKKTCANFAEFQKVAELPFAGTLKRLADQHRLPRSVAAVQSFVQELRQLLPVDADRKRLADYFTKTIKGSAKKISSKQGMGSQQPQMQALSVRQPHAEAILRGIRKIENRSGPTKVRGRIYVYASQSRYSVGDEASMLEDYGIVDVEADDLPRGVLVGTVELFDCEDGEWHMRNPERLNEFLKPKNHPQPVWFNPF